MPRTIPPVHLRLRGKLDEATERLALRAALTASHLLGLATGTHLRQLRGQNDPLAQLQARLEEAELKANLAWETNDMLFARFARIPEQRRPHFTPAQRFRILEIKSLLAWSAAQAARTFLVCSNTILNWERAADPEGKTAGSTVKPTPPIRRAADLVQALVQTMARLGFGGQDLIARVLARAGWRVSARSVGRYRKARVAPITLPDDPGPQGPANPVKTRFVHHTWMMDVTQIQSFLGPEAFVAAVFDAHSRVPLALRVFQVMPGASDMARLFRGAVKVFGSPKYMITDLGGEFTGGAFRKALKRKGVLHRFASAENIKATARLERWWRSLKEIAGLRGLNLALTLDDLERRLEMALVHYVCFRPHEGLGGATPLEVFLGSEPAHLAAIEPPRGRPGEGSADVPFRVRFLGPANRRLPILTSAT